RWSVTTGPYGWCGSCPGRRASGPRPGRRRASRSRWPGRGPRAEGGSTWSRWRPRGRRAASRRPWGSRAATPAAFPGAAAGGPGREGGRPGRDVARRLGAHAPGVGGAQVDSEEEGPSAQVLVRHPERAGGDAARRREDRVRVVVVVQLDPPGQPRGGDGAVLE